MSQLLHDSKQNNCFDLQGLSLKFDQRWIRRLAEGKYSREENQLSHLCVYFAAYDLAKKRVFVGHHKKSGLWLFNGGHVDKGETPEEALQREIGEEWGLVATELSYGKPQLLTVTHIPDTQPIFCREHFDVWYFIDVDSSTFTPDLEKLATEFYENRWLTLDRVKQYVIDPNTLLAISRMLGEN